MRGVCQAQAIQIMTVPGQGLFSRTKGCHYGLMRYLVLLVLGLLLAAPGQAKIYKWKMPDGSIRYSDKPQPGGEEVKLPSLQTYTAPPVSETADIPEKAESEGAEYKTFEVKSPKNAEVVRNNAGMISIQIGLEPALGSGHSIEILMDGKSVGSGRGTSISLSNVDRGSHSIQASIKDSAGKAVKQTSSVTFHLKRNSIN